MNGKMRLVLAGIVALSLLQNANAFWKKGAAGESDAKPSRAVRGVRSTTADSSDGELLSEIERLQRAFAFFRDERNTLKAQLEESEQKNKKLQAEVDKMQKQLEKNQASIDRLRKSKRGKAEAVASPDASLLNELDQVQNELRLEKQLRQSMEKKLAERDEKINDLRAKLAKKDRKQAAKTEAAAKRRPARSTDPDSAYVESVIDELTSPPMDRESKQPARRADTPAKVLESEGELIDEANKLLQEGTVDEALIIFREVLRMNAYSQVAMMGIAACAYSGGDVEMAEEQVVRLLEENPEHPDALGLYGMVLWRQGDYATATAKIQKGLQLAPSNGQLHNYMGIIHHAQENLAEAVKEFKETVKLSPDHVEAHFNLADVLATSEPPGILDAKKHYESALRLGSERNEVLEEILYP